MFAQSTGSFVLLTLFHQRKKNWQNSLFYKIGKGIWSHPFYCIIKMLEYWLIWGYTCYLHAIFIWISPYWMFFVLFAINWESSIQHYCIDYLIAYSWEQLFCLNEIWLCSTSLKSPFYRYYSIFPFPTLSND